MAIPLLAIPAAAVAEALTPAVAGIAAGMGLGMAGTAVCNEMKDAEKEAKKLQSGAATATCVSCQDPKCKQLTQEIESLALALQLRLENMIVDQHYLYDLAPNISDNWGDGSWEGHGNRFKNEQEDLKHKNSRSRCKEMRG